MHFTQLTTKDLIGQTMNIIKEFEGKAHALELQIAMNKSVAKYHLAQRPPNKGGAESARQQAAKDAAELSERHIGHPILIARLAELQELDAAEDAAREAATATEPDSAEADTVSEIEEAAPETVPEPPRELSRAEVKQRLGVRRVVDTPAEYSENGTQPEPVQV